MRLSRSQLARLTSLGIDVDVSEGRDKGLNVSAAGLGDDSYVLDNDGEWAIAPEARDLDDYGDDVGIGDSLGTGQHEGDLTG